MKIKDGYVGKRHYAIYIFMAAILVVSVFVLPKTLAVYRRAESGYANARVACINGEIQGDSLNFNLENIVPGETKSYEFSITNYTEGDKISEIVQTYEFYLKTESNLPFLFRIRDKDDNTVPLNIEGKESNSTGKADTYGMGNRLGTEVCETHRYYLDVTWVEDSREAQYMNEIDYAEIIIKVNQADPYRESEGAS